MSELYEKSLIKLELDQVLELLAECAGSSEGKDACRRVRPSSDLEDVQAMLGGDLNNQIIASSFAARALGVPFLGQYGACSTFVQSLVLGGALITHWI